MVLTHFKAARVPLDPKPIPYLKVDLCLFGKGVVYLACSLVGYRRE